MVCSAMHRVHLCSLPCLLICVIGCPDPEARFDEFLEATKENRVQASDESGESGSESGETSGEPNTIDDMTGTYLLGLEATTLAPDLPLKFVTTIDNMIIAEDGSGATADFTFQPLSVPGECLDGILEFPGVVFDADGNFEIDMGLVMVSGEANPISGTDIEATIVMHGRIVDVDALCGEVDGMLMSPLVFDLAGSNFAAIRLDDDGCTETLPTAPWTCSMVLPAP